MSAARTTGYIPTSQRKTQAIDICLHGSRRCEHAPEIEDHCHRSGGSRQQQVEEHERQCSGWGDRIVRQQVRSCKIFRPGSGSADDNDSPKITDTDKNQILGTLELQCGTVFRRTGGATLLKNSMDAESDLSEQIYTRALMQLASDQIDSNDTHAKCEIDAIVWGAKAGLFDEMDRGMLASQSGITEVEFAEIAYKGAVLNGDDVSCDDVIGDYAARTASTAMRKKQ